MMKAACHPGLPARQQHSYRPHGTLHHRRSKPWSGTSATNWRARSVRADSILRATSPRITVNRWPHGYAYEYNSLFDSFWLEGGETPCEVARKPYGRIAIANADAGAYAYTDEAINQAYRAVGEITKSVEAFLGLALREGLAVLQTLQLRGLVLRFLGLLRHAFRLVDAPPRAFSRSGSSPSASFSFLVAAMASSYFLSLA